MSTAAATGPCMPRRLVADSNVLISALHRRGKPQAIIDLARDGEVDLYLSPFILDEVSGRYRTSSVGKLSASRSSCWDYVL